MHSDKVEVTTYRKDISYSDGRRPDKIEFGTSLREDVVRRDFTINALAWSPKTGIIDYVDGLHDLNKGIVKCVGVAEQRFKEDALRTVRAIRFALKYNFTIEEHLVTGTLFSLYDAIIEDNCLRHISKERIQNEIMKIIPYLNTNNYGVEIEERKILKNPIIINCLSAIFDMKDIFVPKHILPPKEYSTLLEKLYHIYHYTPKKLKEQKFPNHYIEYVETVNECDKLYFDLLNKDEFKHNLSYMVRYLLSKYTSDVVEFVLTKVQGIYKTENLISPVLYRTLQADALTHCLSVKDLDIDGYDLMQLGYKDKQISEKLNICLDEVLKHPEHNDKEHLINFIKNTVL